MTAAFAAPAIASAVPVIAVSGVIPPPVALSLPAGVAGVDLASIPDRLLNDPPAARLNIAVDVRGTRGIASADSPYEIAWSEAGHWYWMRSGDLTVSQLIELAGHLQ